MQKLKVDASKTSKKKKKIHITWSKERRELCVENLARYTLFLPRSNVPRTLAQVFLPHCGHYIAPGGNASKTYWLLI